MVQKRNKQILGIILALVGLLFLLVSNGLLWFGWDAVWPLFLILAGGFFLKIFTGSRNSELLFIGLLLLFMGFFFLVFTAGILPWSDLAVLWPTFPLIGGISLLALSGVKRWGSGSFVIGIVAVVFSVACYMYTTGTISPRVSGLFIRLWPLVLIASGVWIFLKARSVGEGSELESGSLDTEEKEQSDSGSGES